MGATFSSVVEAWTRTTGAQVVEAPRAAPPGCDDERKETVGGSNVAGVPGTAPGGGGGKTLWPELVGKNVIDASHQILQDRREVRVYFYDYCVNAPPPGFDPKRVVLFRTNNRVVTVPKLG